MSHHRGNVIVPINICIRYRYVIRCPAQRDEAWERGSGDRIQSHGVAAGSFEEVAERYE
jgi:hypothetical protein